VNGHVFFGSGADLPGEISLGERRRAHIVEPGLQLPKVLPQTLRLQGQGRMALT
jgi:hypothetical protein